MTSLVAILALRTLCVTSQTTFQIDVRQSERGGITRLPITGQETQQIQSLLVVLSPGIQVSGKYSNSQTLLLRYSPQMMGRVGANFWPPRLVHNVNLAYGIGSENDLRLTVGATVTKGQLDFLSGSGAIPGLENLIGQQPTGQAIGITQYSGFMGLAKQLNRFWKVSTLETANYIATNGADTASFLTGDFEPLDRSLPATIQTSEQFLSKNALEYRPNDKSTFTFDVTLSAVAMSAMGTYLGVMPTVGWDTQLTALTGLKIRGGVFKYWLNPYPGIFNKPEYLPTGEVTLDHTFSDIGLPRLKGSLSIISAPFYNVFRGYMVPRTQIRAELRYAFTHSLEGHVTVRDLLYEMPGFDLRRGSEKNLTVGNVGVRYKQSRWLAFDGALYSSLRSYVPASTLPYDSMQEFYFLVGVTATWQD
jgi:hypothetical protein